MCTTGRSAGQTSAPPPTQCTRAQASRPRGGQAVPSGAATAHATGRRRTRRRTGGLCINAPHEKSGCAGHYGRGAQAHQFNASDVKHLLSGHRLDECLERLGRALTRMVCVVKEQLWVSERVRCERRRVHSDWRSPPHEYKVGGIPTVPYNTAEQPKCLEGDWEHSQSSLHHTCTEPDQTTLVARPDAIKPGIPLASRPTSGRILPKVRQNQRCGAVLSLS